MKKISSSGFWLATWFFLVLIAVAFSPHLARAIEDPCPFDAACTVSMGDYHLALPDRYDGSASAAVLFFHGWGSHGGNILKNRPLRDAITGRGYMIIAPNGLVPTGRKNRSWAHQGSPSDARDELAFIDQVLKDAAARVNLDRERIVVSGFSQGGSMVWHIACFQGSRFRAYLPIAGAFWRPHPEKCDGGPIRMLHLHGLADQTVPIEGRPIGNRWHQGDLFEGFGTLRETNGCVDRPSRLLIGDALHCRRFSDCRSGTPLELCLHDGKHSIPEGWFGKALDWVDSSPIEVN